MASQAHLFSQTLLLFILLAFLLTFSKSQETINKLEILVPENVGFCENITLSCTHKWMEGHLWWTFEGKNITNSPRHKLDLSKDSLKLHITCTNFTDSGNYSCHFYGPVNENSKQEVVEEKFLNIYIKGEITPSKDVRIKAGEEAQLSCTITGYPYSNYQWHKINGALKEDLVEIDQGNNDVNVINYPLDIIMLKKFHKVHKKHNGTYQCQTEGPEGFLKANVSLFVLDTPQVNIDFIKEVSSKEIYLNWTSNDFNEPIEKYFIQLMRNGSEEWTYNSEPIGGGNQSYVIKNLIPGTAYKIKLSAKNSLGLGNYVTSSTVTTLKNDPDFIPEPTVKGVTLNSINIGWNDPPYEIYQHIHYYQLVAFEGNSSKKEETIQPADSEKMNLYLFLNLKPATTYHFKIAACSEFTHKCGNWSFLVNGTTMDGDSDPPENVTMSCKFDNISRTSFVYVTWEPPSFPNGKIVNYLVELKGSASYLDEKGVWENINWQDKIMNKDEKSRSARFDVIPPNTNYTIYVSGVTRSRRKGRQAVQHCRMPPTIPDKDKMLHFNWKRVEDQGRWFLKLYLPRISERNGPICCYRVFIIRLRSQQTVDDLPPPEDFNISSYEEVHNGNQGGVYVAEMFESHELNNEIFLGDGHTIKTNNSGCRQCIGLRPLILKPSHVSITPRSFTSTPSTKVDSNKQENIPTTTIVYQKEISESSITTSSPTTIISTRIRRSEFVSDPTSVLNSEPLETTTKSSEKDVFPEIYDGILDSSSYYTGFIEVIVFGEDKTLLPAYSRYFNSLKPGPITSESPDSSYLLSGILQVLCGLSFIVVILLLALCLLQRYTKQIGQAQGVEMTLTSSFRHLCRSLRGRHIPVSSSPPDMAPIFKNDLPEAFNERHRDSDYGFQHEFEMLPDRFPDRTSRNSEARENLYKNRYPDIKAFDQTRVKLSQVDGVVGSDYINANFVMGYKERKKFICAQGPMDNTVCDFWRMIWEHHLEMILMLTNLEEYSKTKCAKYWPDDSEGKKSFGDINVTHVKEKRLSDFIIRELKISRTNNCNKDSDERKIVQYHYLVWKDFMAPEHPAGIVKFIRRLNEAYSLEKGPILVHCSAGVGRTGTLVALDSLLQQLADEGQVSIFNTVCDLRHQRNFLVQSLKQYIFVYKVLMEVAQFGDTEIKVNDLKNTFEKLRRTENGKDKCKMEEDFEKINRVIEDRKSFSVGGGEENRIKNRSDLVIPYDRNRVILTPIPGKEHSTYINASFIEGYDNSESFIITQDPLENTIPDFWRMVSEQNICTLVMLSEIGDGSKKCIRYWPDDEISHEHINLKYIQNETCPYYTRREFNVTNTKTEEIVFVMHFQYHGWPTVEGEVPEVTRGLIELVDQTRIHATSGPIAVHCRQGSDRSSIFVALSILVQQLRTENRVDVFATSRKLRSQRTGMLQTFGEYEFLHRAILNYADLHGLTNQEN